MLRNPISAPKCFGSAATSSIGGRAGAKQQVIKHRLVALAKRIQLMRQSENNVEVRHAEQFLLAGGEPALARLRLALRAVPVPAGVIRDGLMTALGA